VGLAAIDAAAAGHAQGQRRDELAGRAIAQARRSETIWSEAG
jgi:hypothetical protein